MRHDQRPEVGGTVHLRPVTKTAPPVCHRYLEARVIGYGQWPYVKVLIGKDASEWREMYIHCDNMGLHPSRTKGKTGDQANHQAHEAKAKPFPAVKPIDLPEGWTEETLW